MRWHGQGGEYPVGVRRPVAFSSAFRCSYIGLTICLWLTRLHIIVMAPSYENLRAELDELLARYRAHPARDGRKRALTREDAVERIRKLRPTRGRATRCGHQRDPRPGKTAR